MVTLLEDGLWKKGKECFRHYWYSEQVKKSQTRLTIQDAFLGWMFADEERMLNEYISENQSKGSDWKLTWWNFEGGVEVIRSCVSDWNIGISSAQPRLVIEAESNALRYELTRHVALLSARVFKFDQESGSLQVVVLWRLVSRCDLNWAHIYEKHV